LFAALYAFGGMSWLIWGGFVRTIFVLHTTWLVNSATHVWGYRTHETRDSSTNLWWVALLTYGEGWHNNHHAFQTSARHGLRWWEVDMTYVAIRVLSAVGFAHGVKLPTLFIGPMRQAIASEHSRRRHDVSVPSELKLISGTTRTGGKRRWARLD
jgi:fatty-acid desaturase